MRRPLSTSVPEELIEKMDEFVSKSKGDFSNRSHLVEQAIRAYIGSDLSLLSSLLARLGSSSGASSAEATTPPPRVDLVAGTSRDQGSLYETSTFPRLNMQVAEKEAIAAIAVELVRPGQSLFLDGSTTCVAVSRAIASRSIGLTVVTTSLLVCLELGRSTGIKVVGIGGEYDSATASFVGSECETALEKFYFDWVFVSTKGFVPEEGTFESNIGTLRIKQLVARRSARLALLVDHTKFGERSLRRVLDTSQIDVLVTDAETPEDTIEPLKGTGVEVLVAGTNPHAKGDRGHAT